MHADRYATAGGPDLHVVGESHCLTAAWTQVSLAGEMHRVRPHLARPRQVALQDQPLVAERRGRLAPSAGKRVGQLGNVLRRRAFPCRRRPRSA